MLFTPKFGLTLAALAALGLPALQPASAQAVINGQFDGPGTYTGGGAVAPTVTSGQTWNSVNLSLGSLLFSNLMDSTGAATTVSLTNGAGISNYSYNQGGETLFNNYNYTYGTQTDSVTFSGLNTADTYNLYLYASASNDGQGTTFTVGSQVLSTSGMTGTTFATPDNYVEFTGLSGATGQIAAAFTNNGKTVYGPVNGFQLVDVPTAPVPEASSFVGFGVLLSLGGLALLARRRSVKA